MQKRYVERSIAVVGIVLILLQMPSAAADGGSYLSASDEAWIGERYEVHVVGLPQDVANVTIIVEGGMGLLEYRTFGMERFANTSFLVTESWGSFGTVYLRWNNATDANEEQQGFRVACSPVCVSNLITRAVGPAANNYMALAGGMAFVSIVLLAHGSAVYAKRNNQAPWTETLALAFRSKMSRDPLYRTKTDPLGILPMGMRSDWKDLEDSVAELTKIRVASSRVWSRSRRFVARVQRLEKRAGKLGLLKQTPPGNPISSMKTPEVTVKVGNPAPAIGDGIAKRKPGRPPKSKPQTASEVVKKWEAAGGTKVDYTRKPKAKKVA